MSKKYTFTMVVVKPTGKGGKPLKPKEIKSKNKSTGGSIEKVPGGYSKEGSGRISDKGLKGRSPQQVFAEKEKRMENTKLQGMTKKMGGGMMKKYNKGGQMLKGGQKKLDKNKDGKISGEDFKLIRREKPQPPKMIKKALGGVTLGIVPDKAMKQSQTARDLAGSLGLTGQAMSKFYNKKYAGKKEGGEITYNKRKRLKDVQNPKSEYDKKGKLKYTAAKEGGTMEMAKEAVKKYRKEKASSAMKRKPDSKAGSSTKDIFKSYGKYDGKPIELSKGGEMKKGYGAARQSGMGLQDENLVPGKSMDYYKDLM